MEGYLCYPVRGAVVWPHLIKVSNDLIEEPQTLNAHVVAIQFYVEVVEVGDGGEHDSHLGVGLVIEVLQRQKGSKPPCSAKYGQPTGAAVGRGTSQAIGARLVPQVRWKCWGLKAVQGIAWANPERSALSLSLRGEEIAGKWGGGLMKTTHAMVPKLS